mmetsp:Transcript_13709/g.19373  ORF Transcript_13709/g.19373 Transcript_13709/m.19373 type:complete len:883 (-) Transcript_13709:45-2693(-)
MTEIADKKSGRVLLPSNVVPVKYEIQIEPDLERFTFDGQVNIEIEISSETKDITLHSKEISVTEVSFSPLNQESASIEMTRVAYDLKLTTLKLTFEEILKVGKGTLKIKYQGILNNQMAGLYRSNYISADGEKRTMATTQFESLDARRCFPCWDEPARKAIFEVTLIIPTNRQALCNMPEAEFTLLPKGKTSIRFMPSPLMSTYLLAICVGEFDFIQGVTKGGVSIRVFTPPGKKELGKFALQVGIDTLDLYDDFFQIPYPLPKLDMIAIPDFAMGAMENWGLVTYREVDLLIDEKKASSAQRQRVCTVITHELAHQWFGNLVTMCWWDDLWLNEGFASWMQTYAADILFPKWCMWEQFVNDDLSGALQLDSLKTSHPIQVPIAHAEEVEQVFDSISYCKGACVVRMLYAILGHEKFRDGLRVYMERHKYGNTETFDLWSAWEEVSGMPIKIIMCTWTEKMGYPVVTVSKAAYDEEKKEMELTLDQSWFLADGSGATESKLWNVPIIYRTEKIAKSEVVLMSEKTNQLCIPLDSPKDWFKLNSGQQTLMRVAYTKETTESLLPAIRNKLINPEDRAGLLSDAYALCKAKKLDFGSLISLIGAFKNEDDSTVWEMLEGILVSLDYLLQENESLHNLFHEMASKLIDDCAKKIGWDSKVDDGHLSNLLRGAMIRLLGRFASNTESVRMEATARFKLHFKNPEIGSLSSDYASTVYKIVLKEGGEEEYKQMMDLLGRLDNIAEKKSIYTALGHVQSVELKTKVLDWAISEVKLQDFFYPIMSVASSGKEGQELAWNYYKKNFEKLKKMLSSASASIMGALISSSCTYFSDFSKADEVEKFFQENPMPTNSRKISQVLEKIRINAYFLEFIMKTPAVEESSFWQTF